MSCKTVSLSFKQATSPQASLSQSISALHSIHNADMNVVLTAGTDMRLRYWNLQSPTESYIVAGGASEVINPSLVSYRYAKKGLVTVLKTKLSKFVLFCKKFFCEHFLDILNFLD